MALPNSQGNWPIQEIWSLSATHFCWKTKSAVRDPRRRCEGAGRNHRHPLQKGGGPPSVYENYENDENGQKPVRYNLSASLAAPLRIFWRRDTRRPGFSKRCGETDPDSLNLRWRSGATSAPRLLHLNMPLPRVGVTIFLASFTATLLSSDTTAWNPHPARCPIYDTGTLGPPICLGRSPWPH